MTASNASIELRFEPPGPGPWSQDPVHFPRPLTRYFQETHPAPFKQGTGDFARFYGMLIVPSLPAYVTCVLSSQTLELPGCEALFDEYLTFQ